jgi:hypothetical protein
LSGTVKEKSFKISFNLFKTFIKCLNSNIGDEPTNPILYLKEEDIEFYKEMREKNK